MAKEDYSYEKYPKGDLTVDDLIAVRNLEEIPKPTIPDKIMSSLCWIAFGIALIASIFKYKGKPPAFFSAHFWQAGFPIILWLPYFGVNASRHSVGVQPTISAISLVRPGSTLSLVILGLGIFIQLVGVICVWIGTPRVPILWRTMPKKRG